MFIWLIAVPLLALAMLVFGHAGSVSDRDRAYTRIDLEIDSARRHAAEITGLSRQASTLYPSSAAA